MGSPTVTRGIPPELLPEVARLLLDAFALKVEHELRPRTPEQAHRLIVGSITPDLGWIAIDETGAVVGVAGIGMHGHRFSHLGFRTLAREFGLVWAIPRWALVAGETVLTRPRRRQWRVEVLAVGEAARGTGIGTALLESVVAAAREAGVRSVGLEVVDVNERASQLYERMGFRRVFTLFTGWFTARGGYRGVRFMRLDL